MGNPQVIILDEPFANLDPTTQIRLKKMLKILTDNKKVTVLISSHDLNHVTEVCERIVVLDQGVVVKDIETSENARGVGTLFFSIATISEFYFYFYKLLYNKTVIKSCKRV